MVRAAIAGGHAGPYGVQVQQTGAAVTVTVWSRTDWSRSACAAKFVGGEGTVTLDAALGFRQLVHGRLSRSWVTFAEELLP